MRIIDANTGTIVERGATFSNINGTHTLLEVDEGIMSARGLFQTGRKTRWVPLMVRYLHPGFLFKKVAFIPS